MPSNKKLLQAAAGNAGESLYVEDVFSTYLYEGNSSTQTITNGIDLSGEGGLVWLKSRSSGASYYDHVFCDTERGPTKYLASSGILATASEQTQTQSPRDITSFNSDGFSLGIDNTFFKNVSGETFASWTFRKAEKFFDVVTYTGDGSGNRIIPSSLGSRIGAVIIKRIDSNAAWSVTHRKDGTAVATGLSLNTTSAPLYPNSTNSTFDNDGGFNVGYITDDTGNGQNVNGGSYVAYLFASDAGGFGDDDESIIKCGSFTVSGGAASIDLGWEPQFVVTKNVTGTGAWFVFDNMRGMAVGTGDLYLRPDSSNAESSGTTNFIDLTPTGFEINNLGSTQTFIYIAIRRPMKTPESGTEVFDTILRTGTGSNATITGMGFTPDLAITKIRTIDYPQWAARLTNNKFLKSSTSDAEATGDLQSNAWDVQEGLNVVTGGFNSNGDSFANWFFRRATGFFDVVAYIGDGASSQAINHNLGVTPELIIVKRRELSGDWICQVPYTASPQDYMIKLNTDEAAVNFDDAWRDTAPTATNFTVGSWSYVNTNGGEYIAYLFATLAGVSKVGSYTGTGSNVDVDCGFSAGARFILIKRSDSTGDWYVYDSERGIVAGNDPYLLLNSSDAEVTSTDYIDPLSSGFTVTSSAPAALNASGGTYIFLAIA
jgi:hypothetical protein